MFLDVLLLVFSEYAEVTSFQLSLEHDTAAINKLVRPSKLVFNLRTIAGIFFLSVASALSTCWSRVDMRSLCVAHFSFVFFSAG